jgi:hypothetical protein
VHHRDPSGGSIRRQLVSTATPTSLCAAAALAWATIVVRSCAYPQYPAPGAQTYGAGPAAFTGGATNLPPVGILAVGIIMVWNSRSKAQPQAY